MSLRNIVLFGYYIKELLLKIVFVILIYIYIYILPFLLLMLSYLRDYSPILSQRDLFAKEREKENILAISAMNDGKMYLFRKCNFVSPDGIRANTDVRGYTIHPGALRVLYDNEFMLNK